MATARTGFATGLALTGLATLLLLSPTPPAAEVYKSVDESGRTVYSDSPPPDGDAQRVEVAPAPPSADVEQARQQAREAAAAADALAGSRRDAAAKKQIAEQTEAQRRAACSAARERLQQLESQPPNRRLVIDADGNARRVSWDEMQRSLDEARQRVGRDCRDAPD